MVTASSVFPKSSPATVTSLPARTVMLPGEAWMLAWCSTAYIAVGDDTTLPASVNSDGLNNANRRRIAKPP